MNPTLKLLRYGLPVAALLSGLAALFLIFSSAPDTALAQPAATPAQPPPQRDVVAGAGLVEPSSELIAIATPVSGIAEAVLVRPGEALSAGQALFVIDTRAAAAELASRDAALESAELAVGLARIEAARAAEDLARYEAIADPRAMTEDERTARRFAKQSAEATLALRRAESAEARSQRDQARTQLDLHTVRSPIEGMVLQVRLRSGEFAQASALADPLVTLGAAGPLHVRIDVDEADIGRLRTDVPARIFSRGAEKAEAVARYVRVEPLVIPKESLSNAASERVDTRVLQVIYRLPEEARAFFVGQQVDAFIEVAVQTTPKPTAAESPS